MNCMICGANQVQALRNYKSPFIDEWYTLYACKRCQSYFFDLKQYTVDLEAIYEGYAEKNADVYTKEFKTSSYWKNQVDIIRRLGKMPINSVLDIGCRTGDFLVHWPQDITRVGVELSARSASIAIERGLDVKQEFLEKVEFSRKFDAVTCYAIIEHLPDPINFLQRLSCLVNKDGIVVIMIPTHECFKQKLLYVLGKQWHMYSPPQHLNFMSCRKLDQVMETCGFILLKRNYTSGGMFNPFRSVPLAGRIFGKLMWWLDAYSPLQKIPFFDHMYSYYAKL